MMLLLPLREITFDIAVRDAKYGAPARRRSRRAMRSRYSERRRLYLRYYAQDGYASAPLCDYACMRARDSERRRKERVYYYVMLMIDMRCAMPRYGHARLSRITLLLR